MNKEEAGDRVCAKCPPGMWLQYHYEPSFHCSMERRVGQYGDGGKWVCDPHKIAEQAHQHGCLVYSVGSNGDASFETAVHEEISKECEIHTFDMNPWASYRPGLPPEFMSYHTAKISNGNAIAKLHKKLGHRGRTINILKIDCEGCEWETYREWLDGGIDIRQIQVELHLNLLEDRKRPTNIGDKTHAFFKFFFSYGYVVFHKEANSIGCGGNCIEYAFLKLHPSFSPWIPQPSE